MSVVVLLWRARIRSSWRAAAALVVLIGLGGGVALAVAAGARRTASAFEAILRHTNAYDLAADYGAQDPAQIESLVRPVAGVAGLSLRVGFGGAPADDTRKALTIIGSWSDPVTVGRPVLTAGRVPTGPDEAMLNERAATVLGLGPADHIDILLAEPIFSDFEPVRLDIVGVGFGAGELIEDELAPGPVIHVSRGFTERYLSRAFWGQAEIDVSAKTDPAAVTAALSSSGIFVDKNVDVDRRRVQRSLRPLLLTLAGLAGLAAMATVVVSGQALSRLVRRDPADDRSLRAVGAKAQQLIGADLLYASTVAMVGVIVASGVMVATSPVFPVGPFRRAGLFEGVSIDFTVLAVGSVTLAMAITSIVVVGAQRRRAPSRSVPRRRLPGVLASRPAAATGLRFVTAQRGFTGTVVGAAAGMSLVVASGTFSGSLDRLTDDPALVGMGWDAGARSATRFAAVDLDELEALVRGDPASSG